MKIHSVLRHVNSRCRSSSFTFTRSFSSSKSIASPLSHALDRVVSLQETRQEFHTNMSLRKFSVEITNTKASDTKKKKKQRGFVPRKAALNLTPKARQFLKALLENAPDDVIGVILKYQMSTAGQMKMVFAFEFVREHQIAQDDEGVSLEVLSDGITPKPPSESDGDGLKKLYIHSSAFMKVLGGLMDIEIAKDGSFSPSFKDREGNVLDPNV